MQSILAKVSSKYTHLTFLPHTELFCTFNTTPNSITPVMWSKLLHHIRPFLVILCLQCNDILQKMQIAGLRDIQLQLRFFWWELIIQCPLESSNVTFSCRIIPIHHHFNSFRSKTALIDQRNNKMIWNSHCNLVHNLAPLVLKQNLLFLWQSNIPSVYGLILYLSVRPVQSKLTSKGLEVYIARHKLWQP